MTAESLPAFVSRRRPQWEALERLLTEQDLHRLKLQDLRRLDSLYRQTSADLACAQSFYDNTDALRFLNQLCRRAYASIYRPPRERGAALRLFFASGFPSLVREEFAYIATSAGMILLGVIAGALLARAGAGAVGWLVPPHLQRAIAAHQMWTDDLVGLAPGAVSGSIATNNLSVTIAAFALGVTGGLGTSWILLFNGLLLGAVISLCVQQGMGVSLFSFLGAHGPVELSIIAISGGAGLMMGHALLAPGDRPRGAFVQERTRRAVQLVLGTAPFLAFIGCVEGFVSPGALSPGWAKGGLGLGLGAAFWAYLLRAGMGARPTPDER